MKNYDTAVELFIKNCHKNGLAESTINHYADVFGYLRQSAVKNGFEKIDAVSVLTWKLELNCSLVTQENYLICVGTLSKFGVGIGLFDAPLVTPAMMPNAKKVTAERNKSYDHIIDEDNAKALLFAEKAVYGRTTHTFLRERAMVALMLVSGMRNIEIRSIVPSDLDWENGIAYARTTKGDKPRYVPFSEPAQLAVAAYLKSGLRPSGLPDDAPLFGTTGKDGAWHELERRQLSALVMSYTKSILGEDNACRSHAMRHAAASIALDSGVRMEDVQLMLGHNSLSTTAIYARRLHPKNVAADLSGIFADVYGKRMMTANA